jgi:hypothetical protein
MPSTKRLFTFFSFYNFSLSAAIQLVGAAAADLCERCGGPHTGEQPCFVQPKVFTKQVQWANVDAMEDDDDDDDNLSDEGEEMEGGGRQKPRRKPVRFIFWDVETELIDDEPQPPAAAAVNGDDDVDLMIERRHHTLLVCADVICELCIAAGVRLEEEPMRQAPGCFCGVPWRLDSAARRRWCQPADPTRRHAGTPWPADGLNARRLAFHQFRLRPMADGGQPVEWSEPMAQFVDFLLDHFPRGTRTICLAHNGVSY